MEYRIRYAPVFTVVEFQLNEAEEVVAQPDSMISMTSGIQVSTAVGAARENANRNWLTGFKSMLGGESFFRAVFRAKRDGQTVLLAPDSYGDIVPITISEGESLHLTRGAYLAHTGECKLGVKYGGVKGVLAKTGLFLLHVSGSGMLFCQTYGAIVEQTLAADETFFLDNRYVVAFSASMKYQVVKSSESLKDAVFSGEGFVNRFTGPGRLWYQTRSKPSVGFLGQLFAAFT